MKFNDVYGQEAVKNHILAALKMNKANHAYIINGEQGYGKLNIAKIFAQALLCQSDSEEKPCDNCISCHKANSMSHPDIIYISHEKPNTISVEDIRKQLNGTIQVKPYDGGKKVYIIPDGELMNEQAQNALLKTIEEPPDYAVIIILTKNANSFLQTVLSRCVVLNMTPVDSELIKDYLMENGIVDYQTEMAIAFGEGNPGKAMQIASDYEFQSRVKEYVSIIKNIDEIDRVELSIKADKLADEKEYLNEMFDIMTAFMKDVLLYKSAQVDSKIVFKKEIFAIKEISQKASFRQINDIIEGIHKARGRIKSSVTPKLTIEIMLQNIKENLQ